MLTDKKTKFFISCGFLLFFFLLFGANLVYGFEVEYPSFPGIPAPTDSTSLIEINVYRFKVAIVVSGIIALVVLIIGGVRYLSSVGNPEKMVSAKEQISGAFFGLLILLSSYLLLKTLSPQFVTPDISEPKLLETIEYPETSPLLAKEYRSLIATEIPFGKIIEERILETKDVIPEKEREKRKSRMDRIKDIANNSLVLAEKIIKKEDKKTSGQAEELKKTAEKCSCSQAEPCCENPNPGSGCKDNFCVSKPGCTCDPCKNVRDEIQKIEKENLKVMYEGVEIEQKDASGKSTKIKTSLREEQKKADLEIRLIKEEIGKLERAEQFMLYCPLASLTGLSDFLDSKNHYEKKGWFLEKIRFWDEILIDHDWATFYCPTSGTLWEPSPSSSTSINKTKNTPSATLAVEEQPVPCTREMPVGEIFDRTKKTGYKLIERLEKLIDLNEQLIKTVDELHVLVSQCSSAGPSSDPQRSGCFSVCHKTVLGVCVKYCQGKPCPEKAIEKKLQEIIDIVEGVPNEPAKDEQKKEKEGIKDVVKAKKKTKPEAIEDDEKREQIGIIPIIDETVPKILAELQLTIRDFLKTCVSGQGAEKIIKSCGNAIFASGPGGELIRTCCYKQDWFQKCLSQCYLEGGEDKEGNNEYKKCLKRCQDKKAKESKLEGIAECRHSINFYCCTFQ